MKRIIEKKPVKKLISKKEWTISLNTYDDGTSEIQRTNTGFNGLELLGITFKAQLEILHQIGNTIKIDNTYIKVNK